MSKFMRWILVATVFSFVFTHLAANEDNPFLEDEPKYFFEPYERTVDVNLTVSLQERTDLAEGTPAKNFWHYWYALPPNTMTQSLLGEIEFNVPPTTIDVDEHGNQIAYWNFEKTGRLDMELKFSLKINNVINKIDPEKVGEYDNDSEEYKRYTRSERLIQINERVLAIAEKIRSTSMHADNPYLLAKDVYQWVLDHMVYRLVTDMGHDRGVEVILNFPYEHNGIMYYKGDCGSYAFLYNSLVRALGIPARMAVGGMSIMTDKYHVWSEILIPNFGWIPVDPSAGDVYIFDEGEEWNGLGMKRLETFPPVKDYFYFFGNVDPFRYVSSIGSDIELNPKVDWDFRELKLSWLYHKGLAGVMQVGSFNVHLDSKLKLKFVQR